MSTWIKTIQRVELKQTSEKIKKRRPLMKKSIAWEDLHDVAAEEFSQRQKPNLQKKNNTWMNETEAHTS